MQEIRALSCLAFIATVAALACSRGDAGTAFADSLPRGVEPAAQASSSAEPAQGTALRLVLAPTGNAARYRVREQLVARISPMTRSGRRRLLPAGSHSIPAER
jgi:hypothetical protein